MGKKIEIFKPGKFTAMDGTVHNFSESDVRGMAAVYNPALYTAPLVVGHPKHDAPAYGDVVGLEFAGTLLADTDRVDPAFAEAVNAGRHNRISASFYGPTSPNNPVPGSYYLRHVGFLGAMPPAVKGLKAASFAENEEGVIEFGSWEDRMVMRFFRNIKNYFVSKEGVEKAEQILPEWEMENLMQEAMTPEKDMSDESGTSPDFSENQPGGVMTPEELKTKEQELQQREANLKKQEHAGKHTSNIEFAEALVAAGKLLATNKAALVSVLDYAEGVTEGNTLEFGEGDAKKTQAPAETLRGLFASYPKIIEFGEMAGGDEDPGKKQGAIPTDISKFV